MGLVVCVWGVKHAHAPPPVGLVGSRVKREPKYPLADPAQILLSLLLSRVAKFIQLSSEQLTIINYDGV